MGRIVAGTAGGRRLVMPRGRDTRPTSERTREALFSTLDSMHGSLRGLAFLDLFAGSGAVGLEAASRGAGQVLLVEHAADALTALRTNVAALSLSGVEVAAEEVGRVLARGPAEPFDIVFLDPPYADPIEPVLELLVAHEWLTAESTVVVERASRSSVLQWPDGLSEDRTRRYGDSTLWYGRRS